MATYRYFFCDALSGVLLEELPLDVQSFSQQINGVGTLTGTLALADRPFRDPDTGNALINWRTVVALGRTLVIVQRDDRIVWGGWINKVRPTNGGTTAEIGAVTLEGWLAEQEIQTDLTYAGADVFDIVRGILSVIQGVPGGNIRLGVDPTILSGQPATVTYLGKDSTKVTDAWNRLAEVSPGFEYTVTWSRTGSVFTPKLALSAPGLGSGLDPIVLEYPGNLMDYGYEETAAPNAMTGVGADAGGSPLLARVVDTTGEIAAGYPRVCGQAQFKEEADAARLTARTTTAMQAGLVDNVVPTAELRPAQQPGDISLADLTLGQPARLRVTSLYHPAGVNGRPGIDDLRRITGWTVTPKAAEKVSLNLGSTTGKIMLPLGSRTTAAYLADLDQRVRQLATRT